MTQRAVVDCLTGFVTYVDLDPAEQAAYQARLDAAAASRSASATSATQLASAIAADKTQVISFMNAASGVATPVQRDDTIKAIVRYLRRRGDDA